MLHLLESVVASGDTRVFDLLVVGSSIIVIVDVSYMALSTYIAGRPTRGFEREWA